MSDRAVEKVVILLVTTTIFFPRIYNASREKRRVRGAVAFIAKETLFSTSTAIDEFSDILCDLEVF